MNISCANFSVTTTVTFVKSIIAVSLVRDLTLDYEVPDLFFEGFDSCIILIGCLYEPDHLLVDTSSVILMFE